MPQYIAPNMAMAMQYSNQQGMDPSNRYGSGILSLADGGFIGEGGRIGYREGQGVESIPTDQMQGNSNMQMAKMDMIALEFEQEYGYDMMLAEPELREFFIKQWMNKNFYDKSEAPAEKRVMAQEGGFIGGGNIQGQAMPGGRTGFGFFS